MNSLHNTLKKLKWITNERVNEWTVNSIDKSKRMNQSGNPIEYISHVRMRQNCIQSNGNNISTEKLIIIDFGLRSVDTKRWSHSMYCVYSILFNFCFCFTYIHLKIPWIIDYYFLPHGMTILLTYSCLIFIFFFVIINASTKFRV